MRDYLTLGPTPADESCQQVGTPNYSSQEALRESRIYINQLERVFGPPPEGSRLTIKSFPHDFGSYSEVVVYFDDTVEASLDYAFKLEGNLPAKWDSVSRTKLGLEDPIW